ncbi:MAG: LysM peptidoglycan-binding domain-containing protein [Deltaproteobacteria bacterium]|nr:LysM peptidoglycan-binding domain-containing protein [Deltaproteobacteria bacterium]
MRKPVQFNCVFLGGLLLASACTTTPTKVVGPVDAPEVRKNDAIAQILDGKSGEKIATLRTESTPKKTEPKRAEDIEKLTIDDVIRIEEPNTQNLYDNSRYDFPITMNSRVEGWIDYFTGRGKHHMERYLQRSSRYIPVMKQIFRQAGLPEDLVYLALIESGFNLRARSRAKAVGPWQFIQGTGKRYGLRIDAWVDARRDPIRSTEAAAKYLKDLYLMFESWYLAASAYNAGENKILTAIDVLKTNNYWRISDSNMIRRETKDYIPKLIAAAIIAKNPKRYGFDDLPYDEPLEFESVAVSYPLHLREIAKLVEASQEEISDLNPELRQHQSPPDSFYELRVPVGSRVVVERALASKRNELTPQNQPGQYVVQSGDTIGAIARKFHITKNEICRLNNLNPNEKLSPGLSLLMPPKSSARYTKVKRAPSSKTKTFIVHRVRSGESLWSISEKYNVTVQDLFRWNNLKKPLIQPGHKLRIRTEASADSDEA